MARLGWLGPAIVIVGAAVAGAGAYAIVTNRPEPGIVIDRLAMDSQSELVVRAEDGGDRNFVKLHERGELKWRALTPTYAGRPGAPGIAWSDTAISVRVIRDGRAEIFALARENAAKLGGFKLAPGKGSVTKQTQGPVTLTDHERSYELVEGAGWHQLVAFDLTTGVGVWLAELSGAPIEDAKINGDTIWVTQNGVRRSFSTRDGVERSSKPL
jgi:outer membrane protein assembly factor BamB